MCHFFFNKRLKEEREKENLGLWRHYLEFASQNQTIYLPDASGPHNRRITRSLFVLLNSEIDAWNLRSSSVTDSRARRHRPGLILLCHVVVLYCLVSSKDLHKLRCVKERPEELDKESDVDQPGLWVDQQSAILKAWFQTVLEGKRNISGHRSRCNQHSVGLREPQTVNSRDHAWPYGMWLC